MELRKLLIELDTYIKIEPDVYAKALILGNKLDEKAEMMVSDLLNRKRGKSPLKLYKTIKQAIEEEFKKLTDLPLTKFIIDNNIQFNDKQIDFIENQVLCHIREVIAWSQMSFSETKDDKILRSIEILEDIIETLTLIKVNRTISKEEDEIYHFTQQLQYLGYEKTKIIKVWRTSQGFYVTYRGDLDKNHFHTVKKMGNLSTGFMG